VPAEQLQANLLIKHATFKKNRYSKLYTIYLLFLHYLFKQERMFASFFSMGICNQHSIETQRPAGCNGRTKTL